MCPVYESMQRVTADALTHKTVDLTRHACLLVSVRFSCIVPLCPGVCVCTSASASASASGRVCVSVCCWLLRILVCGSGVERCEGSGDEDARCRHSQAPHAGSGAACQSLDTRNASVSWNAQQTRWCLVLQRGRQGSGRYRRKGAGGCSGGESVVCVSDHVVAACAQ